MKALQALAGWRGYALASLLAAGMAGTAVGMIQGWRYEAEIAHIHAETAQEHAAISTQALDRVAADIEKISDAASRAAGVAPALTARIGVISKALKNATPLPAGCRPDVVRVRSLKDVVDATNRAAIGSQPR